MKIVCAVTIALFAGTAIAEDAQTAETLAAIRDFEIASLNAQSIEARDDAVRFEVGVQWRDPEQRPPQAPASRIIRYVAKCADKTLGVVAVATIDRNGRMLKSYVIPPGGTDFLPVKEGSREAEWFGRVCR
jgi:hypothetical protein